MLLNECVRRFRLLVEEMVDARGSQYRIYREFDEEQMKFVRTEFVLTFDEVRGSCKPSVTAAGRARGVNPWQAKT